MKKLIMIALIILLPASVFGWSGMVCSGGADGGVAPGGYPGLVSRT